jgi:DNA-directed RNA polymerase specialized sigma24 family protein
MSDPDKKDKKAPHPLEGLYNESHGNVINLIKYKARRWAGRFPPADADVDDLVQEGRAALLKGLESWDASKGPLHKFLGVVLDNTYSSLLAKVLAQRRFPYIWEKDEDSGDWRRIPIPLLSVDVVMDGDSSKDDKWATTPSGLMEEETPEGYAITSEIARRADEILLRLPARLTDVQRGVLECLVRPPAALAITARNLTGGYEVRQSHIALYLDITKNQVDHSVAVIRRNIIELIAELGID